MNLKKEILLIMAHFLMLWSCNPKKNEQANKSLPKMGKLNVSLKFYDKNGTRTFFAPTKIWYYDSTAIEELITVNSVTDTLKKTTVIIVPAAYRYIDLKSQTWYLYKNFNDTSKIVKSGILPDSVFRDGGWAFYVNNLPMKSEPQILPDTIIADVKYMRIKFRPLKRKAGTFIIGFLRCDRYRTSMFSFEKEFSLRVNCAMTKYFEFRENATKPFAESEVEFLSDTLSNKELNVFAAWKNNQRNYPVH